MELNHFLRLLRKYWIALTVFMMLGVLAAAALSLRTQPTYTSSTQLFVATHSSGSINDLQQGNSFTQSRVQSYVQTVRTPLVLQPVIDRLDLDMTPAALSGRLEASAGSETVIISISATDASPERAADIARATAGSLISAVEALESPDAGTPSPVTLSVIAPATTPLEPTGPNVRLNLLLGLLAGLAAGTAWAGIRSAVDTKIRGEADLKRVSDAPVLGGLAYDKDLAKNPLLTHGPAQGVRAEAFRQIRTNLQFAQVGHSSNTLLISSSVPGEGKSTTAVNLAIVMAQSGQNVVLVDADLRRPMISSYLGLERAAGLTTALVGQADVDELLQTWGHDRMHVLTSGQIPPNPSELLGSSAMKQLITRLEHQFDAVIIDAPPLLPVTDGAVLAQQVGGVVLVAGSGGTKAIELAKALETLHLVGADLLGIVLNRLPHKGPDALSQSYYAYESVAEPETAPAPIRTRPTPVREATDYAGWPGTRARASGNKVPDAGAR